MKDIKFYITKPEVIRATLAILALRTGTSIAYGGIDSEILAKVQANPDAVNITSGIASFFSGMFGGANVEPIISATAGAPNPVFSGVILLVLMGIILLCGLLPKVGKWVPNAIRRWFSPCSKYDDNHTGEPSDPVERSCYRCCCSRGYRCSDRPVSGNACSGSSKGIYWNGRLKI